MVTPSYKRSNKYWRATMDWTQEQKRLFDKFETSWRVCETLVGHPQHCYKKTERKRDEETERHTQDKVKINKETEKEIDIGQSEKETKRQNDKETEKQRNRETEKQRHRETEKQRYRDTEIQRNKETERQIHIGEAKQINKKTERQNQNTQRDRDCIFQVNLILQMVLKRSSVCHSIVWSSQQSQHAKRSLRPFYVNPNWD